MATAKKTTAKKTAAKKSAPKKVGLSYGEKYLVWIAVTFIVGYLVFLALSYFN